MPNIRTLRDLPSSQPNAAAASSAFGGGGRGQTLGSASANINRPSPSAAAAGPANAPHSQPAKASSSSWFSGRFGSNNNANAAPPYSHRISVSGSSDSVDGKENARPEYVSLVSVPPNQHGVLPNIGQMIFPRFTVWSLTFWLSVVQVAMFVITLIVGATMYDGAIVKGNDMVGPSAATLRGMGAKFGPDIRSGEVYRLIIPIVLHAGIIHIVSNLFFQLRFGFALEKRWNWKRFAAVYLVTGIGASLLSCVGNPNSVSVGASGALFGLLGADLAYLSVNHKSLPPNDFRMELFQVGFVVLVNFLIGGFGTGIDNYAHLGGLITGFIFAPLVLLPLQPNQFTTYFQGASAAATACWIGGLLLGFYLS